MPMPTPSFDSTFLFSSSSLFNRARENKTISSLLSHATLLSFRGPYSSRSGAVSNGTPSVETLDKIQSKRRKKREREKKGKGLGFSFIFFLLRAEEVGRRKGKRVRHFTLLRDTKKRLRFIEFLQRTYNTKELFSVHTHPQRPRSSKSATFFSRPTETDGRVFFGRPQSGHLFFRKAREREIEREKKE